uniref:Fibrillar collagen NC1 domain-containing protein n=1 Tax=Elaeophora elaphi TaxID=1147741 RepID=A0A0R3RHV2_9BILA
MQSMHYSGSVQRKIDFTNATTANWEKISEVERRYKMLKNLIGMEIVQFDLLDHHLICAHDFYVQMFGNANYTQVQTQTGDDAVDCYVQTEELERETIWTQIPYSGLQGWGIANTSNDISYYERFDIDDPEIEHFKINHFQIEKLCKFISVAGQVFIDLMQSTSNYATELSLEHRTSYKFSSGYSQFSLGNLVSSAKVTSMLYWENQLFVAFYVKQSSNDDIANRSIIVEFDIRMPHNPQKILLCHNEIECLCISPDGVSAIFVGLAS